MSIVAVAKRAGVSVATVSRVLNDLHNVRAETVEQVRAAIAEIGYKPPRVKRGPKGGPRRVVPSYMRTGQIAVLTLGGFQNWLGMPVMASVVAGITRAAKELDIRPVLDEMPDPESLSPLLRRHEVDGAIVFLMSGIPHSRLFALREQLPVVWAMGGEGGTPPHVDHVCADNIGIGHLAYSYLAEQGCTEMAFLADYPNWNIMPLRGHGFAAAARDAGHSVTNYVVTEDALIRNSFGSRVCSAATLELLIDHLAGAQPRPDGLFIPVDLLTSQVYPMLLARGIVPQRDMTIVSCDNEQERLSGLNPRPTSIDIRGEQIGRWAVRQLLQRLQRPDEPPARIQIAPRLVPPEL
jgi:DNA-binding LacI/PurR family transcriptional regulator